MSDTQGRPSPLTERPELMPGEKLRDHEYDGIQEYDNPTPGWWHVLFLTTILLCFPYVLIYHFNPDVPTPHERLARAEAEANARQFAKVGKLNLDQETLLSAMNNPQWMTIGASLFKANCVSCHAKEGEGMVGPNLTDENFKLVRSLMDIPKIVTEGAAGNAMPAWRNRLNQNQIVLVSAYVASLRGRNVPGRAPEGEPIPPWPSPGAAAEPRAHGAPDEVRRGS